MSSIRSSKCCIINTAYSKSNSYVTEFFYSALNPSSRTMAPGFTQPETEMSTGRFLGGKLLSACKVDSLTAICEPIVWTTWDPRHLTTP
jgi:hypothetical protein